MMFCYSCRVLNFVFLGCLQAGFGTPNQRVCVIGAGKSGLIACKVLHERNIPYDCFEASSQVRSASLCQLQQNFMCQTCHIVYMVVTQYIRTLFWSRLEDYGYLTVTAGRPLRMSHCA